MLIWVTSLLHMSACNDDSENNFRNNRDEEGFNLALKHCKACHKFPEPALLDKKTWLYFVLPKMGALSGFRHFEGESYFEDESMNREMTLTEWNRIVAYYVRLAPEKLTGADTKIKIKMGLDSFHVRMVSFKLNTPATTFVGIFPHQHERLVFADGISKYFYSLSHGKVKDSFLLGTGISQVFSDEKNYHGLAMGVMHPSDERSGRLVKYEKSSKKTTLILDSLQRPVYAEFADLNHDSLADIIVCEFGNNTGQLSWYENQGRNRFARHVLRGNPGAVRTVAGDFNKDGKTDIMALMAQGDEGMFIYYNGGNGIFREERILEFSPSHGSNYFELSDMNNDGHQDIIATNGDNGDYPPILKDYHGIRIYLNNGSNQFHEKNS